MNNIHSDKYLRVVAWARKRYTENGALLISVGHVLGPYALIELLAWTKYNA